MTKINLKVSIPTFHEISQKLEEKGQKLTDNDTIVLDKDIVLERPIDWRLVTVRKDMVIEAAKIYRNSNGGEGTDNALEFINFVEEIYNYVLTEDKPKSKSAAVASGWNDK